MKSIEKILLLAQAVILLLTLIYSYAFVDLNLTISSHPQVLSIITTLQQLAYYQRPLSTYIFIGLISASFALFIYNLYLFSKDRLSKKYLFTNLILSSSTLMFAYPFLSSDLFNYMFDAKILNTYHQNPYTHKALDFPNDEWLRFMRWVHRNYPYGPLWLVLTLIPTVLGFGKFMVTFFAFKLFIGAFHILNAYLIYKILTITDSKKSLFKTSLYALNPLFLIEGVVNSHNDVVMLSFILMSLLFALERKKIFSYSALIGSALIKYVSIINLPWLIFFQQLDKKKDFKKLVYLNVATMTIFTIVYSTIGISAPFISSAGIQIQFQPWYLFWTLPLLILVTNTSLTVLVISLCFAALMRYLPYIFYGDWSQPGTIIYMRNVIVIPLIAVAIIILTNKWLPKNLKRN